MYRLITIATPSESYDTLIAFLADIGYEGFEETPDALLAYIPEDHFSEEELQQVLSPLGLKATQSSIALKNWNEEWERNFQPVVVDGFCTVRADFHEPNLTTPFEIIITPKMSFGTGHHATTQLMIEAMRNLNMKQQKVLDFGTGTGILGILASKMGAAEIVGVETEEWSCENAEDNAVRNGITNFSVLQGSIEILDDHSRYDILLANINRHILLQYMASMFDHLQTSGRLLLSGILIEDQDIITQSATDAGFHFEYAQSKDNWMMICFSK